MQFMAQQPVPQNSSWDTRYLIGFFGTLVVGCGVAVAAFQKLINPIEIWVALLIVLIAMTLFLSRAYSHRWLGVLIDDRRKYSLSRLQMVLWTVIILSSFVTAVLSNVQLTLLIYINQTGKPGQVIYTEVGSLVQDALLQAGILQETATSVQAIDGVDLSNLQLAAPLHDGEVIHVPLTGEVVAEASPTSTTSEQPLTPISVAIPSEVWLLLGISTTSLVASPLIKGQKKDKIQSNDDSADATLSDLFKGEEGSNYTTLDLAKVQMFYFTLIVVGAYMIAVTSLFLKNSQNAITSLPTLDSGVVAMLGVSHAGYLSNKAIPRPDSSTSSGGTGTDGNAGDAGDAVVAQDTSSQSSDSSGGVG
jgi:hypothetical protein